MSPESQAQKKGPLSPAESLERFDVAEGLEVTLFASEPMVLNPTNLDIDSRGRVWLTEGVNYRRWNNNKSKGDRIVILEDTDHDGKADVAKTYYQDPSINSALGICVLGNRVIVSCSPNVFLFTDSDGDDKPDKKEILFTGISGVQHDHGVHAFTFGPDGRLYFNMGNEGRQILYGDGRPVIDTAGNQVKTGGQPYRQGLVFRCNFDLSGFEMLAHNFRNNYEVAVDSFGTLWQSDNDDDGNRGVRINYVMEHGNYGYRDEITGAGWRSSRTNLEKDIPSRHWHQNDPGVVPNLLQTGAGSPTGILVYEGDLLPAGFQNQMIHCEPGHNVVRAYPVQNKGAGYQADIDDILKGSDQWFRPSDVCIAPDGSLFISDWYDAGVGGHNMADNDANNIRGRVYRVAPGGHKLQVPGMDLKTVEDAMRAFKSPNLATRFLAWTALEKFGVKAQSELTQMFRNNSDPRLRARALHLLARKQETENSHSSIVSEGYIDKALNDADSDIRITALRIAKQFKKDLLPLIKRLVEDPSAQVLRECVLSLRQIDSNESAQLWTELAMRYEPGDRWYLEALGIAASGKEDACFGSWLNRVGEDWKTAAGRDIVWRSRASKTPGYLVQLILDGATSESDRLRYIRSLDFLTGPEKEAALIKLISN
jgi:putative membrane-bound dehydrogenase-like protein